MLGDEKDSPATSPYPTQPCKSLGSLGGTVWMQFPPPSKGVRERRKKAVPL